MPVEESDPHAKVDRDLQNYETIVLLWARDQLRMLGRSNNTFCGEKARKARVGSVIKLPQNHVE